MSICMTEANIEISVGPALDPLVISSVCAGVGIQWAELALPDWSLRMTYAPPSAWVPGNVLLSAVEDSGEIVVAVNVQGSSASDLEVRKNALKAALITWSGVVTVSMVEDAGSTIIAGPWQSHPTVPRWGEVTALLSGDYFQDGVFSIPVNPAGAP